MGRTTPMAMERCPNISDEVTEGRRSVVAEERDKQSGWIVIN